MNRIYLLAFLLLLPLYSAACEFANVRFDKAFSTGRFTSCEQLTDNKFLLTLTPENEPINDSAWYAFKVSAQEPQVIDVVMKVKGGKHRYPPKISVDGKNWTLQAYRLKKGRLTMKIAVNAQPTWIAGQEIITNKDYVDWGNSLAKTASVKHDILGWSELERPIYKVEYAGPGHEWLIILGRQHPPEVTGALALLPFTETIFSDSTLAKRFRQRFNVLVVPNLNPDGVFMGNWRHNANGIDLNRDWNAFAQSEVSAVNQYLKSLTQGQQKMAMAVDFHSTHKDIFYTIPSDYGVKNPLLVDQWLTLLDAQYSDFQVIQKPGNNPDMGVFKQYFADTFNVHAITYEMGDNTDRVFIRQLAKNAADSLMKTMLKSPEQ